MSGEPPDAEPENPGQPGEESASPQPLHMVRCRRCQRFSPAHLDRCEHCSAPVRDPGTGCAARHGLAETQETGRRVSALFWFFAILLLTNVVLCWSQRGGPDVKPMTERMVRETAISLTFAEGMDTLFVIFAFITLRRVITPAAGVGSRRRMAWLVAVPLLALLLAANLGYHWALMDVAGVKPEADDIMETGHHRWWLLALTCVQPAIVEEFFFRRLTFDFFCNSTTRGTAAFASAAMFAAAHTGALISFPYFVLFGIVMAWLRWWSGSLALPMLMHFTHNLLISLHELAAP